MAPSTWLKRLCSAPGKTRNAKPSWWMKRSRCTGRLLISADSRASARMNPWTGSRSDSGAVSASGKGSVQARPVGQVPEGAQDVHHLFAAAQDRQDGQPALRQRLDQELELAEHGHVELGGDAIDQLLERAVLAELLDLVAAQREALAQLAGQLADVGEDLLA